MELVAIVFPDFIKKLFSKRKKTASTERLSPAAPVGWALCSLLAAGACVCPVLFLFRDTVRTVLLWVIGGGTAAILLYLPFHYASVGYGVTDRFLLLQSGVFIRKKRFFYRDRIVVVTVRHNPLTPVFHISTLSVSGPGGRLRLPYLPTARALALYRQLTGTHP